MPDKINQLDSKGHPENFGDFIIIISCGMKVILLMGKWKAFGNIIMKMANYLLRAIVLTENKMAFGNIIIVMVIYSEKVIILMEKKMAFGNIIIPTANYGLKGNYINEKGDGYWKFYDRLGNLTEEQYYV